MSEADWWVCARCTSLNNFAARRCYSCAAKKPKNAVRAAELLNYRVVESWDGKVRVEQREPKAPEPDGGPRPLREPVPRSIEAVARRAPYGSRVTYEPVDPVVFLRGAYAQPQAPLVAAPGGAPVPQAPAVLPLPVLPLPPAPDRPVVAPLPAAQAPAVQQPPTQQPPTQQPPTQQPPPMGGAPGAQPAPVVAVGPGPPPAMPPRPTESAPLWVARASRPAVGGPAAIGANEHGAGLASGDGDATTRAQEPSTEPADLQEPEATQRQQPPASLLVPRDPAPEAGR